jgi:spoIIIJ-associated protein
MTEALQVEATGETVGEAKWQALRELERLSPGLDKSLVRFQVVAEGERGLLGVGFSPARVIATVAAETVVSSRREEEETESAQRAREVVERVTAALGVAGRIDVFEVDEGVTVSCSGRDIALLIGKRGATIDALQYLVNSIVRKAVGEEAKPVLVDAEGYRERRRATLESLAERALDQVRRSGERIELEPMSATERKIVHLRLQPEGDVATESEGVEPNRYVVVTPASAAR